LQTAGRKPEDPGLLILSVIFIYYILFRCYMPYEINEIKDIRKKLGMTQAALAKKAAVSQSLIAKIEAGSLDPTFSNAKKIFAALDTVSKTHELKASDVMNSKIVDISPQDDVREAIKKTKKYDISQIPVVENKSIIGLVSESTIIAKMAAEKDPHKVLDLKVTDVMQESPPIITPNTGISVVQSLLKIYPIIFVSDKGKLEGVITKSDLLRKIYKE
jgi:predicted transcriptional regulator